MKGVGGGRGWAEGGVRGWDVAAQRRNATYPPPSASLQIVALGRAAVPEQPLGEDGTVALGELEGMLESMERRTFVDPVKVWRVWRVTDGLMGCHTFADPVKVWNDRWGRRRRGVF